MPLWQIITKPLDRIRRFFNRDADQASDWQISSYSIPDAPRPPLPDNVDDVGGWNRYWSGICSTDWVKIEAYSFDPVVRTLLKRARREKFHTVFCPGCGVSLEPDAFAKLGFSVTAVDCASVAVQFCSARQPTAEELSRFVTPAEYKSTGSLRHIEADLLDTNVCPGPYDIIICRKTVQWFHASGRLETALAALAVRLAPNGVLVIKSHFAIVQMEIVKGMKLWLIDNGFTVIEKARPTAEELAKLPPGRIAWCSFSTG